MNTPPTSKIASIIIVTYQSRQTIGKTLEALAEISTSGEIECIVVDNTSSDGTADYIDTSFPFVKLIRSETNLGFGNACNLGVEHATTPYLVFLNPDAVLPADALTHLVAFMNDHPRVGICAPAIVNHHAGGIHTPLGMILDTLKLRKQSQRRQLIPGEAPFQTDWLCGAVFITRTSLFRKLSGFDPRFFMYFEETDYCLRTVQAGYEIWAVPTATAQHEGGVSAKNAKLTTQWGVVTKYFFESRYYFLCKHHGMLAASLAETIDIMPPVARAIKGRFGLAKEHSGNLRQRLAGGFLRLPAKP